MSMEGQAENTEAQRENSTLMASYVSRMDAFYTKNEEWLTYLERLEIFFVVNNVPEDKKAASLLTLIGMDDIIKERFLFTYFSND